MSQFKSMILLMAILLMIQPVFQGCTMGYYTGKSHDIESATRYVDVELSDLKKGDFVILRLVDGEEKSGKIKSFHKDRDISIYLIDNTENYIGVDTIQEEYKWNELAGAKKLVIGYEKRVQGLFIGSLFQMTLLFFIFVFPFMR